MKIDVALSPFPLSRALLRDADSWDVSVGRVKARWDHANLRVVPFSDVPERFGAGSVLCFDQEGERRVLQVRESRRKDGLWICDFDLRALEEAEALVGAQIFVHRSMRPPLPAGKLYPDQYIGLRIVTEGGRDLGEIEEVLETPHHEVLVSALALVPDVSEFVIEVRVQDGVVLVRDVPGLLIEELSDAESG